MYVKSLKVCIASSPLEIGAGILQCKIHALLSEKNNQNLVLKLYIIFSDLLNFKFEANIQI